MTVRADKEALLKLFHVEHKRCDSALNLLPHRCGGGGALLPNGPRTAGREQPVTLSENIFLIFALFSFFLAALAL